MQRLPRAFMSISGEIPAVGSETFRRLTFRDQLEIVSLRLFDEDAYDKAVGVSPKSPVEIFLDLPYNDSDQLSQNTLPASFVERYWAGYSCAFKPQWYSRLDNGSCDPLDAFDIEWRRVVNVTAFNFSLLSLSRSLHHLFSWVIRNRTKDVTMDALLSACRMLLWVEHIVRDEGFVDVFKQWCIRRKGAPTPTTVYLDAQREFAFLIDYDDINGYCPLIELSDALLFWEFNDYVVHPTARCRDGRWYYPLIPSKLYSVKRFRVWDWDWI